MDWQNLRSRLAPLRTRWDLAVLANLADSGAPVRPTRLMAAINAQSGDGRISWKVLEERLRCLESAGYIAREEVARVPRETRYRLLAPGSRLVGAVAMLDMWYAESEARANGPAPPAQAPRGAARSARPAPPHEERCLLSRGLSVPGFFRSAP